jgi:hypothetical protein
MMLFDRSSLSMPSWLPHDDQNVARKRHSAQLMVPLEVHAHSNAAWLNITKPIIATCNIAT